MITDSIEEKDGSHQTLLDDDTIDRLKQAFIRQIESGMENHVLGGNCLAYALDAALAFIGLPVLNDEDYRLFEVSSKTIKSAPRFAVTFLDEQNIGKVLSSHQINASVNYLDIPNNENGRSILKSKMEAVDGMPNRYILLLSLESDHGVAYLKNIDNERVIVANSHFMANDPDLGNARGVGIMKKEELIEKVLQTDRGVYLITLFSPTHLDGHQPERLSN